MTQLLTAPTSDRQTMRLTHLGPMRVLLRSLTIHSLFISASLIVLAFVDQSPLLIGVGLFIAIVAALYRAQIEQWMNQHHLPRSAIALAAGYLFALYFVTLTIRDPLIIPIVIIQAMLPMLMGILYDLKRSPVFIIAAIVLYLLLILSMSAPLPTHLYISPMAHLVLLVNALFLGMARILTTYHVVQIVFIDQATESARRLDMLRVLESNLKLRNAQLEQAAKLSDEANLAKTQFLQHMSHELRSPLNTVIGLSEIISEDLEAFPTEMVKEQARQIYKAGQHLLSVISDVLDIAKIESGTLQVYYEEINIIEIIRDLDAMIAGLRNRWPDIVFKMDIPETLPNILGEDRRIRQILINLIDNAFKYTRKGEVHLHASSDQEGIIVVVEDNGIGISRENYQRIFEPFEQVAGQKAIGTGLGLAITRHLVLEHGGLLSVESEVGHGSKFSVFLPRVDIEFTGQGSGTVLLIDSDMNLHAILKHIMERAGYTVVAQTAPDEAREILTEQDIRAVVLDLNLPTEDIGWQFLEELTHNKNRKYAVVVRTILRNKLRVEGYGAVFVERASRPTVLINTLNGAVQQQAAAVVA